MAAAAAVAHLGTLLKAAALRTFNSEVQLKVPEFLRMVEMVLGLLAVVLLTADLLLLVSVVAPLMVAPPTAVAAEAEVAVLLDLLHPDPQLGPLKDLLGLPGLLLLLVLLAHRLALLQGPLLGLLLLLDPKAVLRADLLVVPLEVALAQISSTHKIFFACSSTVSRV